MIQKRVIGIIGGSGTYDMMDSQNKRWERVESSFEELSDDLMFGALPDSYEGYAFLSCESQPLPTKHLSVSDVLRFRDDAWQKYFTNPAYLDLVERRFGLQEKKTLRICRKFHLSVNC